MTSPSSIPPPLRVGIVGGGLAGLSTAAHLLLAAPGDFAVEVLEAAPVPGGQCASWRDARGRTLETGIHLAFPWYHNLAALAAAIGHPLPLRETDGNYYVCNGETGRVDTLLAGKSVLKTLGGLATFPGLTPGERWRLARLIGRILRMDDATAEAHDGETVAEFLAAQGATPALARQLALAAVTIQGLRPEEAGATSFLKFLRTMYGSTGRFDTAFFGAPLGDALIEPLAAFIRARGGRLQLESPIAGIEAEPEGPGVRLPDGTVRRFDHVVAAVPGHAVPALLPPACREQPPFAGLGGLRETPIVTLTLWYDRKVLPDGNVYISNRDRRHGPVFDAVADKADHWRDWPGLAASGSIVQVLIDAADDVAGLADEALVARAVADLGRFFPGCRGVRPDDATVLRLTGTYCGTRPGYWSRVPRTAATGVPGLWLAGDYTTGPYHYGMESAVRSGKEVANRLLALRGRPEHPVLRPRYLPFVRA
ncbi:MAG: hydroxysqualene dehydroxylase [Opitutaceae bacterium]